MSSDRDQWWQWNEPEEIEPEPEEFTEADAMDWDALRKTDWEQE